MFGCISRLTFVIVLALAAPLGCAPPSASLELISVARKGLASAKEAQEAAHAQQARQWQLQAAALDAAFDADVKLAAGGQIVDAQGRPLAMTPAWVISARKGYAAARDLVAQQREAAAADHLVRMDNLAAADEALEMATQLVLQQLNVDTRVRQQLLDAQKRLVSEPAK